MDLKPFGHSESLARTEIRINELFADRKKGKEDLEVFAPDWGFTGKLRLRLSPQTHFHFGKVDCTHSTKKSRKCNQVKSEAFFVKIFTPAGGGGGRGANTHQTHEMTVPNEIIGCVIGKGGSKIAEIRCSLLVKTNASQMI